MLGDLYSRCDAIVEIPVYLAGVAPEKIGTADEGLGHYADAFIFHLAEDICKKLSTGHYTYMFDYEYADDADNKGGSRRITLNSIILKARQPYVKPESRAVQKSSAKPV